MFKARVRKVPGAWPWCYTCGCGDSHAYFKWRHAVWYGSKHVHFKHRVP